MDVPRKPLHELSAKCIHDPREFRHRLSPGVIPHLRERTGERRKDAVLRPEEAERLREEVLRFVLLTPSADRSSPKLSPMLTPGQHAMVCAAV